MVGFDLRQYSCTPGERKSDPGYSDLQWKVVDHLVSAGRDNERVAKEDAKKAVWRNRIWFRHDHHAGPQYFLKFFGRDVLRDDVRFVGNQIDAVTLGRSRLIALIPKEFARGAHGFHRLSRRDLGNDAPIQPTPYL